MAAPNDLLDATGIDISGITGFCTSCPLSRNPTLRYADHLQIPDMPKPWNYRECSFEYCGSCQAFGQYGPEWDEHGVMNWEWFEEDKKKAIAARKKTMEDAGWVPGGLCCCCGKQKLSEKVRGTGHKWCVSCRRKHENLIQKWEDAYKELS